jgi:hypothetical protein
VNQKEYEAYQRIKVVITDLSTEEAIEVLNQLVDEKLYIRDEVQPEDVRDRKPRKKSPRRKDKPWINYHSKKMGIKPMNWESNSQ